MRVAAAGIGGSHANNAIFGPNLPRRISVNYLPQETADVLVYWCACSDEHHIALAAVCDVWLPALIRIEADCMDETSATCT